MERTTRFVSQGKASAPKPGIWQSTVVKREQIADEIQRLAALSVNGERRRSLFVHPEAVEPGLGFAPGVTVALEVLLPGESTRPARENAAQVVFCVSGMGHAFINQRQIDFEQHDAWNIPSMATYHHVNTGSAPLVRFVYSNEALLDKLGIYYFEDGKPEADSQRKGAGLTEVPFVPLRANDDGASLLPYEMLIHPKVRLSPTLHWPWRRVKAELDALSRLGKDYVGRRLFALYNPATEGLNGSNRTLGAAIFQLPAGQIDIPHRHSTVAINYYFEGRGHSLIRGREDFWEAGDLHLSAPGWAVHNHMADDQVYGFNIQDQPLVQSMEALLWQENLKGPIALLGMEPGFETNRTLLEAITS